MPPERRRVYWDACVFLSYINGVPDRLPTIDALLRESEDPENEREIVTSTLSIVEVAFALAEKEARTLDTETERKIDALWTDRGAVKLVEFHEGIAREARSLIRSAMSSGLSLKPADATHLATARSLRVAEFHTYSKDLPRFSSVLGISVKEPETGQMQLLS